LAELESTGLVVRTPDPHDGRQYLVGITGDGRDVVENDLASRDTWLGEAMAELTGPERDLLRIAAQLMEQLADRG